MATDKGKGKGSKERKLFGRKTTANKNSRASTRDPGATSAPTQGQNGATISNPIFQSQPTPAARPQFSFLATASSSATTLTRSDTQRQAEGTGDGPQTADGSQLLSRRQAPRPRQRQEGDSGNDNTSIAADSPPVQRRDKGKGKLDLRKAEVRQKLKEQKEKMDALKRQQAEEDIAVYQRDIADLERQARIQRWLGDESAQANLEKVANRLKDEITRLRNTVPGLKDAESKPPPIRVKEFSSDAQRARYIKQLDAMINGFNEKITQFQREIRERQSQGKTDRMIEAHIADLRGRIQGMENMINRAQEKLALQRREEALAPFREEIQTEAASIISRFEAREGAHGSEEAGVIGGIEAAARENKRNLGELAAAIQRYRSYRTRMQEQ